MARADDRTVMTDFIEWHGSLLRKAAIDRVEKTHSSSYNVYVFFRNGKERSWRFDNMPERDRKFNELSQKLTNTWVEDSPSPSTSVGIYAPGTK